MNLTHGKRGLSLFLLFMVGACAAQAPLPTGALVFGVLGDAPYTEAEIGRLDAVIDRINAEPLAFVVLARIRHPFLLIPVDNECSDCRQPLERLKAWRQLFCESDFLKVERQAGEYCEHVRWEQNGWVFVALNVPGPDNHIRHPEHAPRMRAVFAWLDEAAKLASNAKGLVVLMQANPFRPGVRDGFAPRRALPPQNHPDPRRHASLPRRRAAARHAPHRGVGLAVRRLDPRRSALKESPCMPSRSP